MNQAIKEKTRVTKLTTNQTVRIPTAIVKALRIPAGSNFDVSIAEDGILLTPMVRIPKSQAYYWTKEWQDAEKEVDREIAEGKTTTFNSVEEFLTDLQG